MAFFPHLVFLTLLLTMPSVLGFVTSGFLLSQLVSAFPLLVKPVGHVPPNTGLPSQVIDFGQKDLGAVASESSICSEIGASILKQGGNAADSMIATVACVGVIGMYHSGIGGGGFMLVRSSNGTYEFIDFRETAPAAAYEEMYGNTTWQSIYTGLASAVPGEIKGLSYLHEHYCTMSWKNLIMPAVDVARNGFTVTADLVRYMNAATSANNTFLQDDPEWAIDFAPNGTLVKLNDTITRRRLADTLEHIAIHGAGSFYEGPIAEAIVKAIQQNGGIMTMEDMQNYTVAIREPTEIDYRGYRIVSGSAPSSGSVLLSALNIVEGYDGFGHADSLNLSTHRLTEAMRFAYGQRSELGDPGYVKRMDDYEADMLKRETAASMRAKINDAHTLNVSAYDPSGYEILETPGTSAVVTSDRSGMSISLTTTINLLFGSQVMVPGLGIIMNNEMNDFSIPGSSNQFGYIPSPSNYIRPGKRPLSSITPAIVEHNNGSLYYVVAAAGGSRIITATLQNLWHVLDHNMTAKEALKEPRLHDQLVPNQVTFEWAFDNTTVDFMEGRNHNVTWVMPGVSAAQSLKIIDGQFEAASEPRQRNSGGFVVRSA